jgi:hypothetical protein
MLTDSTNITSVSAELPAKRRRKRTAIAILLFAVALITWLAATFPKQVRHQIEISLFRQPTPYTQLFFTQPDSLPSQLRIDRPNKFSFTIVNDEERPENYGYSVILSTVGSRSVAKAGSLFVASGDSTARTITVVPRARRSRYQITVVLDAGGQSIHFYGETP